MTHPGQTCWLFATALQPALATHMLPHLERDLGRLACTCRAGRELVSQNSLEHWRSVAAAVLPLRHPGRSASEVSKIRADLTTFGASRANLLSGKVSRQLVAPRALERPKFSPDGHSFAFLGIPEDFAEEDELDIGPFELCEGSFCIFVCLEGGQILDVVNRQESWTRAWGWSCDTQIVCIDLSGGESEVHVEVASINPDFNKTCTIDLDDDVIDIDEKSLSLSACCQFFILFLEAENPGALLFSISGDFLAKFDGTCPVCACTMPAWHPDKPMLALFQDRLLRMYDAPADESRILASLPTPGRLVDCMKIECFSPCGSLVCFSFRRQREAETLKGSSDRSVVVAKTDGSGIVFTFAENGTPFSFSDKEGIHAVLSRASTGLICLFSSRSLSVYDIFSGTLTFKSGLRSRRIQDLDFVYGDQALVLTSVPPVEPGRGSLANNHAGVQLPYFVQLAQVSVIQLGSMHQVQIGRGEHLTADRSDVRNNDWSPHGKLVVNACVPSEDGYARLCAKLFKF